MDSVMKGLIMMGTVPRCPSRIFGLEPPLSNIIYWTAALQPRSGYIGRNVDPMCVVGLTSPLY